MSDPGQDTAGAGGPGQLLRRARESHGLSEQQAAEQLNLDSTIVLALENDDFAALGAPVFARGHLRRYGALLGVPDEQLLSAYQQARTRPDQPSLVPHSRLEMAPVRGRPVWPWAIGGTLLFLLAAGLVAYVSEYGLTLPGRPASPTVTGEVAPEDAAVALAEGGLPGEPVAADVRSARVAPEEASDGASSAPAGAAATAAATPAAAGASTAGTADGPGSVPIAAAAPSALPSGHVSLTVSYAADSWTEIYDDAGKAVLYDLGRAGTQRTISAAAPLSVTLGNAPGVTLTVNGRPAALPPRPAGLSVARFKVAADGSLH